MISTKEYAEARKITVAAVLKEINKGNELPGVLSLSRFSDVHVLYVASSFPEGLVIGRRNKYKKRKKV